MSKPLLSVVVTIYNRENYLHRCVDSILAQTYENLEIILVDDGSQDSSLSICNEYAVKDSRVKTFHKENGGLISCWKYGVNNSVGGYVAFVDSDDWILPNMYSDLMGKVVEFDTDIAVCNMFIAKDIDNIIPCKKMQLEGLYSDDKLKELRSLVYDRSKIGLSMSRCDKIIKRELFELVMSQSYANNILEDMVYILPMYFHAKRVFFIDEPYYCYFSNDESMSNIKYSKEQFREYDKVFAEVLNATLVPSEYQDSKYKLLSHFLYIKIAMLLFSHLSRSQKVAELKLLMSLTNTRKVISLCKDISSEKKVLRILLKMKMYRLIVMLKGTK